MLSSYCCLPPSTHTHTHPRYTQVVWSAWNLSGQATCLPQATCLLLQVCSACCLSHSALPNPSFPCLQAHPGGVISLEFERPGHLLATCGADKTVQTWDLNTFGHVTTFHVSAASHNPQPLRDHRPICWSHVGSVEVSVGNSHSRDTCVGRLAGNVLVCSFAPRVLRHCRHRLDNATKQHFGR